MSVLITNHKVAGAKYVPTRKKGGVITPKFIVMHFTNGWNTSGDIHTLAKSTSARVSAHGVLARDGEWTQIVPFNQKAWHAGPSKSHEYSGLNSYSIGIEISNFGFLERVTDTLYKDEYGHRLRYPSGNFRGVERSSYTTLDEWEHHTHKNLSKKVHAIWEPFYPPQLDYLDDLVEALLKEYPSIEYIVGHDDIDTRGWKTDPGPMFPMNRYQRLLDNLPSNNKSKKVTPLKEKKHTGPKPSLAGFKANYVVTGLGFKESLAFRHKPNGRKVGSLTLGIPVQLLDKKSNWWKIRTPGHYVGWVSKEYLRPYSPKVLKVQDFNNSSTNRATKSRKKHKDTCATMKLNGYLWTEDSDSLGGKSSGTSNAIVRNLEVGSKLEILGDMSDEDLMVKVRTEAVAYGYVFKEKLKVT